MFSFHKNIVNFEAFWEVKNFSKKLLFLRSEQLFASGLIPLYRIEVFFQITRTFVRILGHTKLVLYDHFMNYDLTYSNEIMAEA